MRSGGGGLPKTCHFLEIRHIFGFSRLNCTRLCVHKEAFNSSAAQFLFCSETYFKGGFSIFFFSERSDVLSVFFPLKVHKIENFFGSEFEFCTISLLVLLKY